MTIEERIDSLHKRIMLAKNDCRVPSGPKGGQFCSGGGGKGSGGVVVPAGAKKVQVNRPLEAYNETQNYDTKLAPGTHHVTNSTDKGYVIQHGKTGDIYHVDFDVAHAKGAMQKA